jgi:hypothetical protein
MRYGKVGGHISYDGAASLLNTPAHHRPVRRQLASADRSHDGLVTRAG